MNRRKSLPRSIARHTIAEVGDEWDRAASIRLQQILEHRDTSFDNTLLPTIQELSRASDLTRVLDAGCGIGAIAAGLMHFGAKEIVGVDISRESVRLAKKTFATPNIDFRCDLLPASESA